MQKKITFAFLTVIAIITLSCTALIHNPSTIYAQNGDKNISSSVYDLINNGTLAKTLSNNLVNYINESASVLEITSMIPEVGNAQYADKINSSLHGIADNNDIEKRQIADNILKHGNTFEAIFFLLPNGDMYMEEPYELQLDLTKNNFAFRDYYKGAIETKQPFLGDTIVSAATGEKIAVISIPIYMENDKHLLGIWSGVLNLSKFNDMLQSLSLPDDIRVIYVDGNGQKVADSNSLVSNKSESFVDLISFKNGKSGKDGNTTEVINGTKFLVSYAPVEILSKTWIIMTMIKSG
jgi:hypothetical protein